MGGLVLLGLTTMQHIYSLVFWRSYNSLSNFLTPPPKQQGVITLKGKKCDYRAQIWPNGRLVMLKNDLSLTIQELWPKNNPFNVKIQETIFFWCFLPITPKQKEIGHFLALEFLGPYRPLTSSPCGGLARCTRWGPSGPHHPRRCTAPLRDQKKNVAD